MFGTEFLRTRVARRILRLFFVGAIAPVLVLAGLSFRAVSNQLADQSEARLLELADATVQILLERLSSTTGWVESAGMLAMGSIERASSGPRFQSLGQLPGSIEGIAIEAEGELVDIAGSITPPPALSEAEDRRVREGGTVLKSTRSPEGLAMYLVIPTAAPNDAVIWASLSADSLWAASLLLGSAASVDDLCILASSSEPFACKGGLESELLMRVPAAGERDGIGGIVRFESSGERHIAAWRSVYLRSLYGTSDWVVTVSETEASVNLPIGSFLYNLAWALVVGLGLVLLLANVLVRRTMEPLVKLSAGTERIARHDLSARVDVTSHDEFGELASSFNTMAERLSLQFRQLAVAQAIDRVVIEEGDGTGVVRALIDGILDLLSAKTSAVMLFEIGAEDSALLYHRGDHDSAMKVIPLEISASEAPLAEGYLLAEPGSAPQLFAEASLGVDRGGGWVLLAPMVVQDRSVGVAAIESAPGVEFEDEDVRRALHLIDRAAIALNEVRLRRELSEMSWETLRALANTIDAKSKWTAGHSERVTDLAWAIGRQLELGPQDTQSLHRGGLLHDLGKIGVAAEILDFPGRLDEASRRAVKAHPVIGARILEPIRVFRPLLPIVRHHHERWDGLGYPDGLSGTDIPYLARILAVADVFDAMVSSRPYRDGLAKEVVVAHILEGAGSHFDPDVVAAFGTVMAAGWAHTSAAGGEVDYG